MGRRGPKPTPTPLLKLRGSWRGQTREGEPSPHSECPPCPPWVRRKAAKHWGEIAALLEGLGIMARVHTLALALLVDALADWIESTDKADKAPMTCATENGGEVPHPIHGMKGKAWERVLKACREFGMTPSAMSAVRSVKADDKQAGIAQFKLA